MNGINECRRCSHLHYVGRPHTCPHGWGKLCRNCERTRVVGRNKRNRRLYPSAIVEPRIQYAQTKDWVSIAFWTSVHTNGT